MSKKSANFSGRPLQMQGLAPMYLVLFGTPSEAKVALISQESFLGAATQLRADFSVDGVFSSCTNLRTLGVLGEIRT